MEHIIKPYQGSEKYIFISYAHKDSKSVLPVIEKLQNEGYCVWYDEGIDPGTEWDEYIAAHIKDCEYMIAFISRNYIDSDNCMDEIKFARTTKKTVLMIYLEETELSDGMVMRFSRYQSIFKYKYTSENTFYDKLFDAEGIAVCRSTSNSVFTYNPSLKTKPISNPTPISNPDPASKFTTFFKIEPAPKSNPKSIPTTVKIDSLPSISNKFDKHFGIYKGEVSMTKKRHGKGKFTWKNGDVYEGDWKYNNCTGKGRLIWNNGDIYEGDFVNGKRTGRGKFISENGDIYEGNWLNDKHTDGTLFLKDGTVIKYNVQGKVISTRKTKQRKTCFS